MVIYFLEPNAQLMPKWPSAEKTAPIKLSHQVLSFNLSKILCFENKTDLLKCCSLLTVLIDFFLLLLKTVLQDCTFNVKFLLVTSLDNIARSRRGF